MSELLSISIPTRNRSKCLDDLLFDISASVENGEIDKSLFKIYIFDNASIDKTSEVVSSHKAHLPIIYKINQKDIGMGLNIYQAYTAIEGEYVWVIGDDELLPKPALSVIFRLIKEFSPALIIPRGLSYKGFVKLPKRYSNYSDFAKSMQDENPHYLIAHSLISANVIKRSFFDKKAAMNAMDTYYGHMYGIASGLKLNSGCVVLPKEETIIVREVYLGPVDGHWPDSIEKEQVVYLEWLKNVYQLNFDAPSIIPTYRAKLMPNIFVRGIKYILRNIRKKLNEIT
jgi:glycosyltransferase involved in cell wall biosynthesis